MKKFNKLKARKVVKTLMSPEQYKKMSKLLTAAINDQEDQPLQFGIPEDSVDITEQIYYVVGKSGEIYQQNQETIERIFDDFGVA
jgi:hypothetical protein